ncbi:hypothetical protein EOPP23_13045 [Endozoicomonas sp. OPT23]|uniref:flagellar hook-length control protein FliK n=1 Tax=Endozoicomonas sp. OPT23 TaxID=2072845 RepID=UPI00129BBAB1|nr:flagellar hook-length control protein FliK [Endozoicomonas sp. OPT23]MRI33915.1 hypothetical protein [Endozoicomonas sp. OPT23]
MNPVATPVLEPVHNQPSGVVQNPLAAILGQSAAMTEQQQGVSFERLIDQYLQRAEEQGLSDEQLDVIRSSMEEMDDSEIHGFLAMLQNQAEWQPDSVQQVIPAGQVAVAKASELGTASGSVQNLSLMSVMNKALTDYMPVTTGKENQQETTGLDGKRDIPAELAGKLMDMPPGQQVRMAESQQRHQDFIALKMADPALHKALDLQSTSHTRVEGIALSDTSPESQPMPVRVAAETVRTQAINDVRLPHIQTTVVRQDVSADRNWSDAIGQRLVTMLSEGKQEARIRLDPPELGTMGVRLVVQNNGVSVQFNSDIPQVRELLESQADRLRMAMDQQGMNLVDVNVGRDQSGQQGQRDSDHHSGLAFRPEEDSFDSAELIELPVALKDNSLINTFA